MMHLSDTAVQRRREDFLAVAGKLSVVGIVVLTGIACGYYLSNCCRAARRSATLRGLVLLAAALSLAAEAWGLAVLSVVVLGWLLAEPARL